jgi:hypothetical protein
VDYNAKRAKPRSGESGGMGKELKCHSQRNRDHIERTKNDLRGSSMNRHDATVAVGAVFAKQGLDDRLSDGRLASQL